MTQKTKVNAPYTNTFLNLYTGYPQNEKQANRNFFKFLDLNILNPCKKYSVIGNSEIPSNVLSINFRPSGSMVKMACLCILELPLNFCTMTSETLCINVITRVHQCKCSILIRCQTTFLKTSALDYHKHFLLKSFTLF